MGTYYDNDEEYQTATKFYYYACLVEHFERPKQDNTPCLACEETLFNKEMWNNILRRGGTCNEICQYTILINDWICKRTPIDDIWKQALRQLKRYSHDKHKLWRMANAKAESMTTSELLKIKNNPLSLFEPEYILMFNVFSNIEDDLEEFHEHYQQLAPT
ncbi:hypothetical protein G9A89_018486 [Geosiphon pyriformis]|nr:hypothetical protein G9A89_018486 [Geosiphon pyriformis]